MNYTLQRRTRDFLFASGCPFTVFLIVANVATFFLLFGFPPSQALVPLLSFSSATFPHYLWTAVTWPILGLTNPIGLLFGCFWAYWVCGSLERSWGTRTFGLFFAAAAALMALSILLGGMLLHHSVGLIGLWLALAAPTIAWCAINQKEEICLYFVLKIPAPFLAILTMVFVWFEVGPPLLGLFALIPCAAAYWYATQGRYAYQGYTPARSRFRQPAGRPSLRLHDIEREEPVRKGVSPLAWFRAWQEKRKLEKLWKRSFTDTDDRKHHR